MNSAVSSCFTVRHIQANTMNAPPIRNRYRQAGSLEKAAVRLNKYWFKWAVSLMAALAIIRKDIVLSISMDPLPSISSAPAPVSVAELTYMDMVHEPPLNVSLLTNEKKVAQAPSEALPAGGGEEEKRKKQEAYIQQFAHLAQTEMQQYGIPASITLAQGLLETNAGESPLAKDANNHFGIKCFSKVCRRGHCRNFEDDSHKDFFRIYSTPGESYRAHSALLQKARYRTLYRLSGKDYAAWARGLKKAGYATDPRYAEKLIRLIEEFRLYKYDS